ncbi:MAG: hypothetical protein KGO92_07785 [Bacteroidota bacterium]|nr:hypothetical protein [Bacteroidota bacterium]
MLQLSKAMKPIAAIVLVAALFSACKKDAFSEKDAIAAQTTLLTQKFSYDLAIKQIDLQIQRSGDSAKIVIQNLINSGATALEILKQTNMLAQIMQNQANTLAQLKFADSLARNTALLNDQIKKAHELWTDSVNKANTNATNKLQLQHNYAVTVLDYNGRTPLANATVSVLPYGTTTIATASTDANGIAKFEGLIIDPAASFVISATNYGSVLVQENNFAVLGSALQTSGSFSAQTSSKSTTILLYNAATNRNTINGSLLGDLDLTNGDAAEGISGQLLTFSSNGTLNLNGVSAVYQFATLSDANGKFTIKLPDGSFVTSYPNIKVQQKLFVNAWQDEDASSAVPRIDSVGTTLSATAGFNISSGSAYGYYVQFPDDKNGKKVYAANGNAFPNYFNTIFSPYNYSNNSPGFPFTNISNGSIRTDSIIGSSSFFNNWYFNNSNNQSLSEAARYRTRAGNAGEPLDTVEVKVISLVPGWIIKSPLLKTIISSTGYVNGSVQLQRQDNSLYIQKNLVGSVNPGPTNYPQGVFGVDYAVNPAYSLYKDGAGGVFNQAAMYTPTGRQAWFNLSFASQTYTPSNNLGTNATVISVNGGSSYFLPIEYKYTTARDRNPR